MRHGVKLKKLGRTHEHRSALMNNLLKSLIQHKQIKTTTVKAKVLQSKFDRLVTFAKKNDISARRETFKYLQNRTLVKVLFDDIAPQLNAHNGGYTRTDKLGFRKGDGAELSLVQIIGFEKFVKAENNETTSEVKKSES